MPAQLCDRKVAFTPLSYSRCISVSDSHVFEEADVSQIRHGALTFAAQDAVAVNGGAQALCLAVAHEVSETLCSE